MNWKGVQNKTFLLEKSGKTNYVILLPMGELILYGGLALIASTIIILKTTQGRMSLALKRKALKKLENSGDTSKYEKVLNAYTQTLMKGIARTLFNLNADLSDKFASFAYGEVLPAYINSGELAKSATEEELRHYLSELRQFLTYYHPAVDQDALRVFKARGTVNRINNKGEKFDGEMQQLIDQVLKELSPLLSR